MDGHYHFLWLDITRQAYTVTCRRDIKGAFLGAFQSEILVFLIVLTVRTISTFSLIRNKS